MIDLRKILFPYADKDAVLRRKANNFFFSLTLIMLCIIVFLISQSILGIPYQDAFLLSFLSLILLSLAMGIFYTGHFGTASTAVLAILFVVNSLIVYEGSENGIQKIFDLALFQGLSLFFSVMVSTRRLQILLVGAAMILSSILLTFITLLPAAGDYQTHYYAALITTVLLIVTETGIGLAVYHILHSALEETHDIMERDVPSLLPNGKKLDRISRELFEENRPFHLLFFKIENFTELLLNLSHDSALEMIVQSASYLRKISGGEVFRLSQAVLCLVTFDSRDRIRQIARETSEYFRTPVKISPISTQLTVRMAVLEADRENRDIHSIINRGYLSLLKAQQEKKAYLMPEERDEQNRNNRINFLHELSEAIRKDEFRIHYQPIVNDSRKIVSFEALSRWTRKDGGEVSPDYFIPLMERTGLISDFFTLMMEKVLKDLGTYEKLFQGSNVWVNVSPELINQGYDFNELVNLVDSYHIPHDKLGFELTETSLAQDHASVSALIAYLHGRGFSMALDDFGIGYSNLSQVLQQSFNKIKFDRSFLHDLAVKPQNKHLLKLLIEFFQEHHYVTVVEGIETEEEFDLMKSYGCHTFQGFLFHRPDAPDQLLEKEFVTA